MKHRKQKKKKKIKPQIPLHYLTLAFNYTGVSEDEYSVPSQGTKVRMIDYGKKKVEMVFQGTNIGNADNHPMHLHGLNRPFQENFIC
jgi:laccase